MIKLWCGWNKSSKTPKPPFPPSLSYFHPFANFLLWPMTSDHWSSFSFWDFLLLCEVYTQDNPHKLIHSKVWMTETVESSLSPRFFMFNKRHRINLQFSNVSGSFDHHTNLLVHLKSPCSTPFAQLLLTQTPGFVHNESYHIGLKVFHLTKLRSLAIIWEEDQHTASLIPSFDLAESSILPTLLKTTKSWGSILCHRTKVHIHCSQS